MIHRYKLGGLNIVLDVCSGSVHVVDEVAYDIIGMYETSTHAEICAAMLEKYGGREDVTEQDILECCDQIEQLKADGKLFAPDTFEPIAGALKQKSANVVKALCLHVAHTCNLNCAYCFASQGKYHGDRAIMSFEVGRQALDFLIEHSGQPPQSGGRFLRRRTADELRRRQAARRLRAQPRKGNATRISASR
jgi:uncharacterized protein